MSLLGILNLGGSALAAQQAALQVTGNNLANAGDPNYSREVANQNPAGDSPGPNGLRIGNGVTITSIQRQVDQALQERLRSAGSDQSSATTLQTWSGQVQSVFNALSGQGVSDQLNTFFNDWSSLAANPGDAGKRQVVLQDGQNVSQTFNALQSNLATLKTSVQGAVGQAVQQVNVLTSQVATFNAQIVASQAAGAQPNSLLDQRDAALKQLSQLANVQTAAQPDGSISVYSGSESLVQGAVSHALTVATTTVNGHADLSANLADGSPAPITAGQLGGLFQSQALLDSSTDSVNALAAGLISSVNKLHTSGQGTQGFTSLTGTNAVSDPTKALTAAGLTFPPVSGSFVIHLTDKTTGLTTSSLVPVTETGAAGDTTLNSLAASLSGVSGVQATVANGKLTIQSTNANAQISFSQDSSGALSALGINTFFSGSNASDIAVNSQIAATPSLLAAAANGNPLDNTTALAITQLNDAAQTSLGGSSLSQAYNALVQKVGSTAANATTNATATTAVQQTLSAQQQALSGVSTNEEALNMITEQRTFQGAAQLISTLQKMMDTLLAIT